MGEVSSSTGHSTHWQQPNHFGKHQLCDFMTLFLPLQIAPGMNATQDLVQIISQDYQGLPDSAPV